MSKKYIITNDVEINESNVREWIDDFCSHIKSELVELDMYYEGKDDLGKIAKDSKREGNTIHINLAYKIVNEMVSYCFGKPMTYDFADNYKYEDYIRDLQYYNNDSAENIEIEKDCSKYGLAYEFIGLDENKKLFYKRLSPLNTFKVVDDKIIQRDVCVITFSNIKPKNGSEYKEGYIYTKEARIPFVYNSTVKFGKEEANVEFPDTLPVVAYKNNDELIGDFEMVKEPLSAYSKLFSCCMDDVDAISNAILLFYNADMSEEDKEELNRTRVVGLQGENAKAEYIYKKLDINTFKELKEALKDEILSICSIPDMSDVTAYNKSASAIRYKLIGIEATRHLKNVYMEMGLRKRLDILSKYTAKPFDIKRQDVKLQFYSNLPANIDADLDLLKLVKDGGLSLQTYLEQAETAKDATEEYKRIQKEQRQRVIDALKEVQSQIKTASDEYDEMNVGNE